MKTRTYKNIWLAPPKRHQLLLTITAMAIGHMVSVPIHASVDGAAPQSEAVNTADAIAPADKIDKQHFISVKSRWGGIFSSDDRTSALDKANIWTLQLDYRWQVNSRWALGIGYAVVGVLSDDEENSGDNQSDTRLGVPLFYAARTWHFNKGLSLSLGGGLTAGVLAKANNRSPEYVSGFVTEGYVFSSLAGQRNRVLFADYWTALILPLRLSYSSSNGLFLTAQFTPEVGFSSITIVGMHPELRAGYKSNRWMGFAGGVGYIELYPGNGGHMIQLSGELGAGVNFGFGWITLSGLFGRDIDNYNVISGQLDARFEF